MITEIIKNDDIDTGYMLIRKWIRNGITNDAVCLCRDRWENINNKNYVNTELNYISIIRNQDDYPKPISKW